MPASSRVSRSKPRPTTRRPSKPPPRRRKASGFWSTTATVCPRCSTSCARVEPVRPHPMITKCTRDRFLPRAQGTPAADRHDGTRAGRRPVPHRRASAAGGAPPSMPFVLSLTDAVKRLLVGRPVHSDRLAETLLPKRIALPVFASDALSSVAYAPDEILLTLAIAGSGAFLYSPWVTLAVVVVMVTVVASYRQNVHAYPSGGGDYEVATVNLGPRFGVGVASALLVDYVLTVAVSVSSGVENLGSAWSF